jgi:long-chain fatty acid transport protein
MLSQDQTFLRSFVSVAALIASGSALAGGYFIPDENARDLGLSQAAIASQTGPEAISQNTAALAGQNGLAATVSLEALYNQTTWSDPALGTASLNPKANTPPAAALAFGSKLPYDIPYGVGAGFLVLGGGSLLWPADWPGAQQIQTVNQTVYLFELGAAVQPVPFLKLGANLLYYRDTEDLTQAIGFIDHLGTAELGLAGGALSYGVSGEFDIPGIPLKLGVSYRHKGEIQLSGDVHFDGVPPTFQPLLHDQSVSSHVTIPNEVDVGASYAITPTVQVMGVWNLERWIVYRQDQFIGADGFSVTVPRDYHNAYVFRLAAEWKEALIKPLTLRIGVVRSYSPQPTDTVSPSLTDGDSWAFSLGVGYEIIPALRVDVGYQHAIFDNVTSSGTEAFPGTYKTNVDLVSLGLTFRTGQ